MYNEFEVKKKVYIVKKKKKRYKFLRYYCKIYRNAKEAYLRAY